MTTREKVMSVLLGGFIVVAGLGFLYYLFVYGPLVELEGTVKNADADLQAKKTALAKERANNKAIEEHSPRLKMASQISLPELPADLAAKEPHKLTTFRADLHRGYHKFLEGAFSKAGFDHDKVKITFKDPPKVVLPAAKGAGTGVGRAGQKAPPYVAMEFTVDATGPHDKMLAALRELQQAPVLHATKVISLEKPLQPKANMAKTDLILNLKIEVLQLQGAEKADPKALVDVPKRIEELKNKVNSLALLPSQYADTQSVLKNDWFLGKPPPPPRYRTAERLQEVPLLVQGEGPPTSPSARKEEPKDVLGVVKLDQVSHNGQRWTAYYYDQARGTEHTLNLGGLRGFELKDRYDNPLLKGEVINISTTEGIYFKTADGKVYHWAMGDVLLEALARPLDVVAVDKKSLLLKGLPDVAGLAVMSYGDVWYPYAPRPAAAYGMGAGLASLPTPKPRAGAATTSATKDETNTAKEATTSTRDGQ